MMTAGEENDESPQAETGAIEESDVTPPPGSSADGDDGRAATSDEWDEHRSTTTEFDGPSKAFDLVANHTKQMGSFLWQGLGTVVTESGRLMAGAVKGTVSVVTGDEEEEDWNPDSPVVSEWMSPKEGPLGERSNDGYPMEYTQAPPLVLPKSEGSIEEGAQGGEANSVAEQGSAGQGEALPPAMGYAGTLDRGGRVSQTNCFTSAPSVLFPIRSRTYLADKKKYQPEHASFELIGCDSVYVDEACSNIAAWDGSLFQRYRRHALETTGSCPRVLIYFAEKPFPIENAEDEMYRRLLDHFMAGPNDAFRKNRFKLIPNVVEGPWVVKQAANVPALIGKKLTAAFTRGEGYLEISIDVGSSVIAGRVLDLCKGFAKSLVIDMAYTIEAKKEEELPERLIGACRLHFIDLDKMQHMSGSSAKGKCGGGEEPESSTGESVTVEQAAPVETVPSSRVLWGNQHIPEGQVSKVGASDGVKVAVPDAVDAVPSTVDAPPGGGAAGDAR